MLLEEPIKQEDGTLLIGISINKDGNFYFLFQVPQHTWAIGGKNRKKADELLIVGVPRDKAIKFGEEHGVKIRLL